MKHKMLTALLLAAAGCMLGGTVRAESHITPVVVLHQHAEVIEATLPGAKDYFERTVDVGLDDLEKLDKAAQFKPDTPHIDFYYGVDKDGKPTGTVVFVQENTQHGPLEVGVTLDTGGAVRQVSVAKTTIEARPWIDAIGQAGVLARFQGLHFGDDPTRALAGAVEKLAAMPAYYAKVTAQAVKRGLALYHILYLPNQNVK